MQGVHSTRKQVLHCTCTTHLGFWSDCEQESGKNCTVEIADVDNAWEKKRHQNAGLESTPAFSSFAKFSTSEFFMVGHMSFSAPCLYFKVGRTICLLRAYSVSKRKMPTLVGEMLDFSSSPETMNLQHRCTHQWPELIIILNSATYRIALWTPRND